LAAGNVSEKQGLFMTGSSGFPKKKPLMAVQLEEVICAFGEDRSYQSMFLDSVMNKRRYF
jgi:hypothetical protein